MNHGTERRIWVSGLSIDAAIAREVLRVLKPLGIEAAAKAIDAQSGETTAAQRQLELSLQQARYEAAQARRQYDAVDPANRLVAGLSAVASGGSCRSGALTARAHIELEP
jgi:hypothetical protein